MIPDSLFQFRGCYNKWVKVVVTHSSPDMDAITSVWLIKKLLPGWEEAEVKFVPAGEKLKGLERKAGSGELKDPTEQLGEDEVIHVDTGLGPLDHHQIFSDEVCAASRVWEFVKAESEELRAESSERVKDKIEAIDRIVKVVVDIDHFKEVFWADASADYHEFNFINILDGLKLRKPDQDGEYVNFGIECLESVLHEFENRIWAEREIKENGREFETRFGKGMGFETINDSVLKLAQKMGAVVVVRRDPRKGYVRIKATPGTDVDFTLVCEKLKKIDPDATWFLHVGKKMLLNGTPKNPKMIPTKLTLQEIINVVEKV